MADEKKDQTGTTQTDAANNSDSGAQASTKTMVDEAREAAERLEKANERQAELLRQQQEAHAQQMLGGKADNAPQPEKKEKDPKQYAQEALGGKVPEEE